jgi:octaprenyl-diphosphate synthase
MGLSTHKDVASGVPGRGFPAFKLIEDSLDRVRDLINANLTVPVNVEEISRLIEYMNARSGKMLRPGLVLLAGGAVGQITDGHIRVAAIMEMIHNATLLHDDVIDEGQKRRGMPTINKLWGNESAVILGDFLLSRVFKMCSDLDRQINNMIASIAAQTCEGELRQVIPRSNRQLNEAEYIDIITEKSAAFFSGCCSIGALLAKAGDTQVKSLESFGLNAGIAFQIADDLLDLTVDESKTGKTAGSDVNKNKRTLAVIHLLGVIDDKERKVVHGILDQKAGACKDTLLEMLRHHRSLEYAHNRTQEFLGKALSSLNELRQSDAKTALIETAKFMANSKRYS